MRPLRAAVALSCAAFPLLIVTAPAVAQPTPPSPTAAVTWGVAPSSPQGPDGRGAYEWTLDPGAVLNDVVAVSNFGDVPLVLDVYASDAFTTAEGGFDLLPAVDEPVDVGAWIAVGGGAETGPLTVPPRSRLDVPFRVDVPANATPGDHVGGVVAALATTSGEGAGQVRVDRRVGARVYLRVTGETTPALAVQDLTVEHRGTWNPFGTGSVTATYTVRNTGNLRLAPVPSADVSALLLGDGRATGERLPELLPGGDLRATVRVDGVRPWLRLAVAADATADGAATATARATVWVVPWPLVWVLALALAVVAALRLVRRGRARAEARADARAEARLAARREEQTETPETPATAVVGGAHAADRDRATRPVRGEDSPPGGRRGAPDGGIR